MNIWIRSEIQLGCIIITFIVSSVDVLDDSNACNGFDLVATTAKFVSQILKE